MSFIDVHNHCMWGVDDGLQNKEQAHIMFDKAQKDGIKTIFATPHFIPGKDGKQQLSGYRKRIEEVKECAKKYEIDIYLGCELCLNHCFYEALNQDLIQPLGNTNYILVEFDIDEVLRGELDIDERLYELIIRGYHPLIAHAERYFNRKINVERVQEWIDMGCYIQVNRSSLMGVYGTTIKRNAWALLSENVAHVVASDAHKDEGKRICCLSDVYQRIIGKINKEIADLLCIENPERIVRNEETLNSMCDKERYEG